MNIEHTRFCPFGSDSDVDIQSILLGKHSSQVKTDSSQFSLETWAAKLFSKSCCSCFGLQKPHSLGKTSSRAVKYTYSHKSPVMAAEINRLYGNGDLQNQQQRTYQVVVATRDLGIGKDGKLPWNLPSDLKYFKEVTVSTLDPSKKNAVIMGRKTWESILLQYRPLPGRLNIILTHSGGFDIAALQNVICCASLSSALEPKFCGDPCILLASS